MRPLLILALLTATVSAEDIFQPTGIYAPKSVPVVAVQSSTERWLVSEPWCQHCPEAKARFLQSGGSPDHVLTIAEAKRRHGMTVTSVPFEYTTGAASTAVTTTPISKPVVRQSVRKRLPVVRTQWGTIDLETYNRNCNCPMCRGIRAMQQQYRQTSVESIPAHQQPTPDEVIDRMLDLMRLTSEDVHEDAGCGDGRVLIASVQRSGCRGIGVEIDPIKADEARQKVAAAGLSDRIEIITGDVLEFDPSAHGVTAISAYLYPELLAKLAPKFRDVRIAASPFHAVPGLAMTEHDDVWIYRSESSQENSR